MYVGVFNVRKLVSLQLSQDEETERMNHNEYDWTNTPYKWPATPSRHLWWVCSAAAGKTLETTARPLTLKLINSHGIQPKSHDLLQKSVKRQWKSYRRVTCGMRRLSNGFGIAIFKHQLPRHVNQGSNFLERNSQTPRLLNMGITSSCVLLAVWNKGELAFFVCLRALFHRTSHDV